MSINWVMLSETQGFVPLPGERIVYTSPPRTTLALQTPNKYPGKEPLSIHSSAGCVHLTNQRIVYLPAGPTPQLQSFSAPILNLHDTHVSAPFFGPNVWTGILQPVPGGGIPPQHAVVEIRMVFKDGGAFDFHSQFERIKERLEQAVEVARESGAMAGDGSAQQAGRGGGPLAGVSLAAVHLDELPAYAPGQQPPTSLHSASEGACQEADNSCPSETDHFSPPTEPPPGYEEVQRESVADELERRLRASQ
ncbi:hypothetical protein L228DRAFT_243593 [Xylona heveae TC161]|uniref:WW-domain-binding protein n=1 Tax=Xylona heveae (strain CBS 132557 / TC161) TaxID=1328760 RepID=A0A165IGE4_XYLHT|nr:hypothetical protein L228DRAFT_243593 [Xylona heveae TC161]KZF24858.1 hypothetical protein L228DRAFT_243593 [Xylona heveae TC161]